MIEQKLMSTRGRTQSMTRFILLAAALVISPCSVARSQPTFTTGIDLVRFGVTVIDREGNFVTDLVEGDFEIQEEGVEQSISYFVGPNTLKATSPPLHLGLLFDTSASMETDLRLARTAAIKFLNTVRQAEDITLVDFDTEVRVGRYRQSDFPRLIERIRGQKPDGWTALYDALGVYLDGAAAQDGQKILVLYTDGGDTRSELSYGEALDLVKASDVTVYAIGFLKNDPGNARLMRRVRTLAETTGGDVFLPLTADPLDEIYAQIAEEIAARYSFGYASTDTRTDGAWREVRVKLSSMRSELDGATVRPRRGYFGPYRPPES
ncbi:MAG: hypothetical protein CL487_01845 [Acidobacteria bacterium]|nr:hypothetical protein [Acidobacteriota bacterium]